VDGYAGVALTPTLRDLAGRTVRFDNAYTDGPWTTPGMLSVFTGLTAAQHGIHHSWSVPSADTDALVKRMLRAGRHCPNLCYLNQVPNYFNLGYSAAESPPYPKSVDDDTLPAAIASTPEPFFLWFHYKWMHLPYWASAEFRDRLGVREVPKHLKDSVGTGFVVKKHEHEGVFDVDRDADPVRRMYAAGVLEMDRWLGRVFEALDRRRLLDHTTVVLTADHGEELLEHGFVGHASTSEHAVLWEEVIRVPLLVVDPRLGARRVQRRIQGHELFAGLQDIETLFHGGNQVLTFHSSRRGYCTPREEADHFVRGISDGKWKLVEERFGDVRRWLFDLESDPGEQRPVTNPDLEAEWVERLNLRAPLD
jgi:arylsulfatase A-like enzyme